MNTSAPKRVLFLTLYPEMAASPRYRVHQFLPYLASHGVECTVRPAVEERVWRTYSGPDRQGRALWYHLHETPRRTGQLLSAHGYDVVVLQKALTTAYVRGFDRLLSAITGKLLYDIDDAVHLAPPHPLRKPWSLLEDRGQVQKVMGRADLVLAGNTWLAAEAETYGGQAVYFPTVVDTDRFIPAPAPRDQFRAGWMGAPSTAHALEAIGPALETLSAEELIVAGAHPGQVHWDAARHERWRYDTEVQVLQQFSVGLMPLPRDEWTRGKCALKALLYMACGIPCVATPYGAVTDIIEHGVNGWFAETSGDWKEALGALRDPALRRRLGEAARATVEERFSLRSAAPVLLRHLESV